MTDSLSCAFTCLSLIIADIAIAAFFIVVFKCKIMDILACHALVYDMIATNIHSRIITIKKPFFLNFKFTFILSILWNISFVNSDIIKYIHQKRWYYYQLFKLWINLYTIDNCWYRNGKVFFLFKWVCLCIF